MGLKGLAKRFLSTMGYEPHPYGAFRPTWVPPGHFYSPIVDPQELRRDMVRVFNRNGNLPDIDLHDLDQLQLLNEFQKFYDDIPFTKHKTSSNLYYYENEYYSYGDAIVLYSMLRYFKPKRLIEFGSGFSSCLTLDTNRLFLGNQLRCVFIDPYPERIKTLSGKDGKHLNIIESRAQDVNLEDLPALESNDIVFIDSMHVSKVGSDVNFYLFEFIPNRPSGVLIHFHDIFYLFEYPED